MKARLTRSAAPATLFLALAAAPLAQPAAAAAGSHSIAATPGTAEEWIHMDLPKRIPKPTHDRQQAADDDLNSRGIPPPLS